MTISIQGVNSVNIFKQGAISKQALSAASQTVSKGLYDATTLSAVDADLAVANIKAGVNIFGFVGTLAATPAVTNLWFNAGNVIAYDTVWTTRNTGSVPAAAKQVIFICSISGNASYLAEAQILYNAVQRAYASEWGIQNYYHAVAQYSMDGIGSAADAVLQSKNAASGINCVGGACWYVTV